MRRRNDNIDRSCCEEEEGNISEIDSSADITETFAQLRESKEESERSEEGQK